MGRYFPYQTSIHIKKTNGAVLLFPIVDDLHSCTISPNKTRLCITCSDDFPIRAKCNRIITQCKVFPIWTKNYSSGSTSTHIVAQVNFRNN